MILRDPELYKQICTKNFDSFVDHLFIIEPHMDSLMGNTLFLMVCWVDLLGKLKLNFEKISPFECGFLPFYFFKIPISINFFLISILFIIFDIEIAFIFPIISRVNFSNILIWWITIFYFLIIIYLGLIYEWLQNILNWK